MRNGRKFRKKRERKKERSYNFKEIRKIVSIK
jgi:hypothetical protein